VTARIWHISINTFREAVRDRVLYNLVLFALLLLAVTPMVGKVSIGIERIVLVNLGLAAITTFGVLIAIFIGIGLVSKEIDKRTLYTVLSRPVRRWEFILGKYVGLVGTLVVNTGLMTVALLAALFYVDRSFTHADLILLASLVLIILEFCIVVAIALLFSSFTTPAFSALFAFSLFVVGSFADDLRTFARSAEGFTRWIGLSLSYLIPNFAELNTASSAAHGVPLSHSLYLWDVAYAITYSVAALAAAMLLFERRDLK